MIHACEYARDVLPIVEGQVAVGMRPYIVTPQGRGSAELFLAGKELAQPETLSLLRAWQDVRNWRKSLLDCDPENSADLVHTHSFASGMAGVRNVSCVVYDLEACIEELAISAGQCERGSWMARSFRVAEQFIATRAKAVIVHAAGMRAAMLERGAAAENVFVIPDPVPGDEQPLSITSDSLRHSLKIPADTVVYLLPAVAVKVPVLQAYAQARAEIPKSVLLIETQASDIAAIQSQVDALGIRDLVICIQPNEVADAMWSADAVIAVGEVPADPVQSRHPNPVCLQAFSAGRALLAADVPWNRDATPDGRGCLWFKAGDARDLGQRMTFLAQHPEFRAALAAAGREYLLATRSSAAVGRHYDAAYRHALKQKRAGGPGQSAANLLPITSVT